MNETLALVDYRSRVAAMYQKVRADRVEPDAWVGWKSARNDLFGSHPQSPVEDRSTFEGLDYFGYDSSWKTTAEFIAADPEPWGEFDLVGTLSFSLAGIEHTLPAYWLRAYAGGFFVPFGDETNGVETYEGGRYILDTAKGADLGTQDGRIVLDFNYSYHPSCAHSLEWVCPLPKPESRLPMRVIAGERLKDSE